MPRKREVAPFDYDPFAERPRCRLTKKTIELLKDHLGKRNLKDLPRYIKVCVSCYLSWTVQIKRRPKRGSRSDTLKRFIAEVAALRTALNKASQLDVSEYLAKARSFSVEEIGNSGTKLILGLPERLGDLRAALRRVRRDRKAEKSAETDIHER